MPFGQVPALEYDGEVLTQSTAIARFLAKEFGLAGKTNLEQAQADMVCDAANDLLTSNIWSLFFGWLNFLFEKVTMDSYYSDPWEN